MTTQLRAQKALTAHLVRALGMFTEGTCMTLSWRRSFLATPGGLQHEYDAWGFNTLGKYESRIVTDSDLRDVVYMNL